MKKSILLAAGLLGSALSAIAAPPISIDAKAEKPLVSPKDTHTHLLVRLKTDKNKDQKARRSLNLALVIDRSGSMSGTKIIDARSSAIQMIKQMRDGDYISLVSYSDDVKVLARPTLINDQSRRQLTNLIHTISDGGGTNLGGGLVEGIKLTKEQKAKAQVNRVLLISDGRANKGIIDPAMLNKISREALQQGIVTTTIGLGINYNEDLMTSIANNGGGNYYFVEESNQIKETLSLELSQMATTVGKALSLKTTLPEGLKIEKVYGWEYTTTKQTTTITLGEIFSSQTRSVLLKVKLPKKLKNGQIITIPAMDLNYQQLTEEDSQNITVHTKPITLTVSDDNNAILTAQDMEVTARVAEIEMATRMENIAKLVEQHKFAEAKKFITESVGFGNERKNSIPAKHNKDLAEALKEMQALSEKIAKAEQNAQERKKFIKQNKSSKRKYYKK